MFLLFFIIFDDQNFGDPAVVDFLYREPCAIDDDGRVFSAFRNMTHSVEHHTCNGVIAFIIKADTGKVGDLIQ